MSYYLAWGIVPYLVMLLFALAVLWTVFVGLSTVPDKLKRQRRILKVLAVCLFVFVAQWPWKHNSTHYQNYRLHFNKGVEYNDQQIEKTAGRESWEERSSRLLKEAKQSADERTTGALSK